MEPNERFKMTCRKLGWGDASGGLWFVGVEESGFWDSRDGERIDHVYADGKLFNTGDPDVENEVTGSSIREKEGWIAAPLMKEQVEPAVLRRTLWDFGRGLAHLNLRPLPKENFDTPFPAWYRELFGFDPNNSAEYAGYLREYRYPLFQKAREIYKPQAIVCMSKMFWPDFKQVFGVESTNPDTADSDLMAFSQSKVILAHHFSWKANLTEAVAARIATTLKGWGVILP